MTYWPIGYNILNRMSETLKDEGKKWEFFRYEHCNPIRFRELFSDIDEADGISKISPPNSDLIISARLITGCLQILKRPKRWAEGLAGLRILDLGCGSEKAVRNLDWFGWTPFFCRIAAVKGAQVTGVDIFSSILGDQELYQHLTMDLFQSVSAQRLAEDLGQTHFDIVIMQRLAGTYPHPDHLRQLEALGLTGGEFDSLLFPQVLQVTKEGGIFYYDEEIYQREGGRLVLRERD